MGGNIAQLKHKFNHTYFNSSHSQTNYRIYELDPEIGICSYFWLSVSSELEFSVRRVSSFTKVWLKKRTKSFTTKPNYNSHKNIFIVKLAEISLKITAP